jgi:hypothetical protein
MANRLINKSRSRLSTAARAAINQARCWRDTACAREKHQRIAAALAAQWRRRRGKTAARWRENINENEKRRRIGVSNGEMALASAGKYGIMSADGVGVASIAGSGERKRRQ